MMPDQLPMFPLFRAKGDIETFYTLRYAAKRARRLTLNRDYRRTPTVRQCADSLKECSMFTRSTMFEEVEVFYHYWELPRFKALPNRRKNVGKRELAKMLADALTSFLGGCWDSKQTYLFVHSSGHDTRLLSAILREMAKNYYLGWFASIYFLCFEPEIAYFKRIMKHEGWIKYAIMTVPEGWSMIDVYAEAMQFSEVGANCSDINRIGLYGYTWFIKKIVRELEAKHGTPVMILMGMYADETMKMAMRERDVPFFVAKYLNDTHFELGGYDVLLPYVSFNWLDVLFKRKVPFKTFGEQQAFKRLMIGLFDEELAELPRHSDPRRDKFFSEGALKKMQRDFEESWYYRECLAPQGRYPQLPPRMRKNGPREWREYFKAAICEHLINEGCKINV